jgi:hypothetical protein
MRRTLFLACVCVALLAALPAAASARDRNDDGLPDRWERKHRLSLKVNQARRDQDRDGVRNRQEFRMAFDPRDSDSDDDGVEDSEENAGTVESFANGVLAIKLVDGTTLSGKVTEQTEIECETAGRFESDEQDDGERGDDDDDRGRDESGDRGDRDDDEDGDRGGRDDDEDEDDDRARGSGAGDDDDETPCGPEALTAGAVVHEAELNASSDGAVFTEVELVK